MPSRVRVRKIVPTTKRTATIQTGAGMPENESPTEVALGAHELELGEAGERVAARDDGRQAR